MDFADPLVVKYGHVQRPTLTKAYVCVFVSVSIKAVHLEPVTNLTSDAFIACLRRFVSHRGKPSLILIDHGTNFVGAKRELQEFVKFLEEQKTQKAISEFCSTQIIQWHIIPEHAPHFGGLWETAVKSFKFHLRKVAMNVKFTFKELTTLLTN